MRLASLNCPNCNAPLREENEKFICSACGSAFTLDYDESDVEHERLRTEAEKERIKTQREIELAATKIQLEEEAKARQLQRAREERSAMVKSGMKKMLIYPVVLMVIASSLTFLGIFIISHRVMKSSRSNSGRNAVSTTIAARRAITGDDILADTSFTENALASGLSFAKTSHSENVFDWNLRAELDLNSVPEAKISGEPKLLNVYFVDNGATNFFIMVYELNFTYVDADIDRTTTVYYADYLSNITCSDAGKIQSDFNIRRAHGASIDVNFDAYYDKDQLYRETVMGRGGEVTDLTSDLVKESEA